MKKYLIIASLLTAGFAQAQTTTLIDIDFPDGTGTNAVFELEKNGSGGAKTWTQATGVLTVEASNGRAAARSVFKVDALDTTELTFISVVGSVTGTTRGPGAFIGFQSDTGEWISSTTSFGMVVAGNSYSKTRLDVTFSGTVAGIGFAGANWGITTLASFMDGYSSTVTINSTGWTVAITGLLDAGGDAITGGSGTWGTGGTATWAQMKAEGLSVTTAYGANGAYDMQIDSMLLTTTPVPEPGTYALLAGLTGLVFVMVRRRK